MCNPQSKYLASVQNASVLKLFDTADSLGEALTDMRINNLGNSTQLQSGSLPVHSHV